MQYVPLQITFSFLYRVFILLIRSSLFSDSLESSSNHLCSNTLARLLILMVLILHMQSLRI